MYCDGAQVNGVGWHEKRRAFIPKGICATFAQLQSPSLEGQLAMAAAAWHSRMHCTFQTGIRDIVSYTIVYGGRASGRRRRR